MEGGSIETVSREAGPKDFELASRLTEDEIAQIMAGVDPNDIGREFDAEELDLIKMIQDLGRARKGPSTFIRPDPYARHRRHPRGDRQKGGPAWRQATIFKDDENKIVDLEATRFERTRQYLLSRRLHANRATSFKKLSKASRILRGA